MTHLPTDRVEGSLGLYVQDIRLTPLARLSPPSAQLMLPPGIVVYK